MLVSRKLIIILVSGIQFLSISACSEISEEWRLQTTAAAKCAEVKKENSVNYERLRQRFKDLPYVFVRREKVKEPDGGVLEFDRVASGFHDYRIRNLYSKGVSKYIFYLENHCEASFENITDTKICYRDNPLKMVEVSLSEGTNVEDELVRFERYLKYDRFREYFPDVMEFVKSNNLRIQIRDFNDQLPFGVGDFRRTFIPVGDQEKIAQGRWFEQFGLSILETTFEFPDGVSIGVKRVNFSGQGKKLRGCGNRLTITPRALLLNLYSGVPFEDLK